MSDTKTLHLRRDIIKPLPSQTKALDAMWQYEYTLFGGAAGPGKSYLLRWAAVELLLTWAKKFNITGARVGLFCEDYPTLRDRQISKIKREFPSWLGTLKETKEDGLCFHIPTADGMIALRNLDDPSKYASTEFAAILVDELTKNPRQTFDDLRFRKRWPGIEHSPFIAASNPGSQGHAWVKKLWLDRDFSGDDANLDPSSFHFIPARVRENPYQPESYWSTLHSLPESMRKAMEEGNWDLFVGQYFSEWNRDHHVCQPFPIPYSWKRIIGIDYGFEAPSAVGWWAVDPDGHWYGYRELYQRGMTYTALGNEIMERTPVDERIDYVIADPSIWGDRQRHDELPGDSGGALLQKMFARRRWNLYRANHDRLQGWQRCRQLLKMVDLPDGRKTSHLHVFSTCKDFIRTIPSLVHDDVRTEDLDTKGDDHCADSWRYSCNTMLEVKEQVDELVDVMTESVFDSTDDQILSGHRGYGWK